MADLAKASSVERSLRALRVISGLYLLGFVASHLSNLSLGLISIEAMDAWRPYLTRFWTMDGMRQVLLVVLLTHYLLGLQAIYLRPSLGINTEDVVQVISGLLVLPLLAVHAVGVAMLKQYDVTFTYEYANFLFWVANPAYGLIQILLLSVVWIHGCAGLFTWLRSKRGALAWLPWLYPLAVAMPVVALLGYVQAGRTVLLAHKAGHDYWAGLLAAQPQVGQISLETVRAITNGVIWVSAGLAVAVLAARWVRQAAARRGEVSIIRNRGPRIVTETGQTLLGALVRNHQPHARLCAGRGRCGTCAVVLRAGNLRLQEPSAMELETLRRTGAPAGARLACQVKLAEGGHLEIEALYPADYTFDDPPLAADRPGTVTA